MMFASTFRRSCAVFFAALITITATHAARGGGLGSVVAESAAWAAVSTVIFATWDWRRRRRGEHCAVCDGPLNAESRNDRDDVRGC
jgi:hypothetical protein